MTGFTDAKLVALMLTHAGGTGTSSRGPLLCGPPDPSPTLDAAVAAMVADALLRFGSRSGACGKGVEIVRHMFPWWLPDREAVANDMERLVELWIAGSDRNVRGANLTPRDPGVGGSKP